VCVCVCVCVCVRACVRVSDACVFHPPSLLPPSFPPSPTPCLYAGERERVALTTHWHVTKSSEPVSWRERERERERSLLTIK